MKSAYLFLTLIAFLSPSASFAFHQLVGCSTIPFDSKSYLSFTIEWDVNQAGSLVNKKMEWKNIRGLNLPGIKNGKLEFSSVENLGGYPDAGSGTNFVLEQNSMGRFLKFTLPKAIYGEIKILDYADNSYNGAADYAHGVINIKQSSDGEIFSKVLLGSALSCAAVSTGD